ncbi:MAG: tRNA pseudouridine(38-40) synthase TruA [Acidobacteria bacterium]|nr:tRNA pseudouridine(38-40) synthase TruA [Acidobacteriota bacterium]
MPKWKLVIEYEGTRYRGWQEQKNARSVQGEIRKAAEDFLGTEVEIAGSGRTDAGVHALYQVAHLRSSGTVNATVLRRQINDRLPADICVRRIDEASPGFHARHHAEERFYLYQISTRRTAFGKRFVWWVKDRLNIDAMKEAAASFLGRHDFSPYRDNRDKAGDGTGSIVEVTDVELGAYADLILFRIGASHFLWKMVRRITGVLVEVGRGNLRPDQARKLPASDIARMTAPPSGLFLEYVRYPGEGAPGPLIPAVMFRHGGPSNAGGRSVTGPCASPRSSRGRCLPAREG